MGDKITRNLETPKYPVGKFKNSLFSKVRRYVQLSKQLQEHLNQFPEHWHKYQKEFNCALDTILQEIRDFEINNTSKENLAAIRLKSRFEKRYRQYFLYGEFIKWSFEKPYGYPGDFKIIDEIYLNQPRTNGFDRLWDNYFQQLLSVHSIRERKEDFKKFILDYVKKYEKNDVFIMNLASGPAREIMEIADSDSSGLMLRVIFDCYDFDKNAIIYAKNLIQGKLVKANFFVKNAIRLALSKNITNEIKQKYDLIYSMGLFDYFDGEISTRLIANLRKLLNENGMLIISTASEKVNNSSAAWMEWVANWHLIYRSRAEFQEIFEDAGFPTSNLRIILQRSKVMQYCLAINKC